MSPVGTRQGHAPSTRTVSGLAALLCTMIGAVMLALLIPFGTLSSCSPARITLFLVVLGASAVLALVGTVVGGISYRRSRDRLALYSLLFAVIYAALLVYLLGLFS